MCDTYEMSEFKQILDYVRYKYDLRVEYPYGEADGYTELYTGKKFIGGFNFRGFSLVENLYNLTKILKENVL